nr:hypothetical protein [uncultured Haemophilus sp.]
MTKLSKFAAIPLTSLLIIGCSEDPKAPSIENYKIALQKALDTQPSTCFVVTRSMDVYFNKEYPFTYETNTENVSNSGIIKTLNGWTTRGVLELKESKEYNDGYNNKTWLAYDYTDKAKKEYDIEDNSYYNIKGRKFCVSSKKVLDQIIQASEPLVNQFNGKTSVDIVATYKVEGLPDWGYEYDYYKNPIEDNYKLILMHDGWVEESQIK